MVFLLSNFLKLLLQYFWHHVGSSTNYKLIICIYVCVYKFHALCFYLREYLAWSAFCWFFELSVCAVETPNYEQWTSRCSSIPFYDLYWFTISIIWWLWWKINIWRSMVVSSRRYWIFFGLLLGSLFGPFSVSERANALLKTSRLNKDSPFNLCFRPRDYSFRMIVFSLWLYWYLSSWKSYLTDVFSWISLSLGQIHGLEESISLEQELQLVPYSVSKKAD